MGPTKYGATQSAPTSKTPMADNAYGNVDDLPESVFDNIPLHRARPDGNRKHL